MTQCPCCSNQLLRQIRKNQISWFCRHCWLDMPKLTQRDTNSVSLSMSTQLGIKELLASH